MPASRPATRRSTRGGRSTRCSKSSRRGGEAEKEAQAREQYFRFQQDVQNALSGEPYQQTRNWNGLPSGAFQHDGRRAAWPSAGCGCLMGLPPSDGQLIRPTDEPVLAKIDFDWNQVTGEATTRRAELRRQKWQIRRRELELIASKNYLLPRLDARRPLPLARLRRRPVPDQRAAAAAIRQRLRRPDHRRLPGMATRLRAVDADRLPPGTRRRRATPSCCSPASGPFLRDQQREVVHEAADAIAEMDRAYAVLQTSYNRLAASDDQLGAVQAAYEADKAPLDLLLEAQRRRRRVEPSITR